MRENCGPELFKRTLIEVSHSSQSCHVSPPYFTGAPEEACPFPGRQKPVKSPGVSGAFVFGFRRPDCRPEYPPTPRLQVSGPPGDGGISITAVRRTGAQPGEGPGNHSWTIPPLPLC